MIEVISIISLLVLLFVSIKYSEYSLAVFMPIFILLPYTVYFFGLNLLYWSISIVLIGAFLQRNNKKETIEGIDSIFITYMSCIIILSLLNMTWNQEMSGSQCFSQIIRFILENILILLLFNHLFINQKAIRVFDYVLYFSTTIVVLYAYYNYFSGSNPYRAFIALTTDVNVDMANEFQESARGVLQGRVSSTFVHPLSLGQFILLVSSYIIYKLKFYEQMKRWSIIIILLSVAFLSGSRSSFVPMILLIWIYLFSTGERIRKTLIFISIVTFIGFILIPNSYQDTISSMITFWDSQSNTKYNIEGSSIELRQAQIQSMIKILESDIFFGRGLGYITLFGSRYSSEMLGYESIVFEKIFETGIVGLLLFLMFYIFSYLKLVKFAKTKRNKYRVHSLCLPFLLCIFMTGLQYGMFVVYLVFYIMTMYSIYNEERTYYKTTYYDTKNNSLLLA